MLLAPATRNFYVNPCSAPLMYARVLEKAALAPGQRVLCVGSGTGYLCAIAAELVKAIPVLFFHPVLQLIRLMAGGRVWSGAWRGGNRVQCRICTPCHEQVGCSAVMCEPGVQ